VVSLTLSELFSGQKGCLAILHSSGQYLETVARWGDEALVEPMFSLEDCWAMRRGRPHEVVDPNSSLLCRHFIHPPETGYLCLPLMVQGETLGVFCLGAPPMKNGEARVNQHQLAVTVGEAIKLSFSNLRLRERLRSQATRDKLTGLFNRRYLEDSLPRELHRALRRNAPLSLAMLDLDHFKLFNDTYGHDAGDVMLRESGRVLRENLRMSDIACRYGGEEFLVVLPDSPVEETWQRVEQIRLLFKEIQIRYGHELLGTITVSAGIAGLPQHGSTPDELLRAADNAMYAAKEAGRNCVVLSRGASEAFSTSSAV
jgi:diguanylate cyclase (GGDEF)-like protein